MEQKVFLVEQASGKKIALSPGKNTLGRGPMLGIEDKKLSRQQIEITWENDGSLQLLMNGTNPSFLGKVGVDTPIQLKKGDTHTLNDGDIVTLLVQDYAFRILIERASSSSANQQKRKQEIETAVSDEGSPPQKQQLKKQKSELPVPSASTKSKLPVCMYGPGCYRKNPQHFLEFSHPWKDKPEAGGGDGDEEGSGNSSKKKVSHQSDDDEIMETAPAAKKPAPASKPPVSTPSFSSAAKPAVSFSGPKLNTNPPVSSSASVAPKPVLKPTPVAPTVSKPPAPAKPAGDDDDEILEDAPVSSQRIIAKPAAKFLLKMDSDEEDDANKPKSLDQAQKDTVTKLREHAAIAAQQSPKKASAAPRVMGPGGKTLAFPPFSTTSGAFTPPAKAVEVALEVIAAFLKKNEKDKNLQLILVEPNESILKEFKLKNTIKDPRFILRGGDITKLNSAGVPCKFIANSTNWRFKNGGVGINKLIHDAAGPLLYEETKKRYQTAAIGSAYSVPLPSASPLHKEGGIDWVIHVNPPSMDKSRPDSITDLEDATAALKKCYVSLFETFYKLASL